MSDTLQIVAVPKMSDRVYRLVNSPAIAPLGMQRRIVLAIMQQAAGKPVAVKQVAEEAAKLGLQAAAGVSASVAWHLNEMRKLGWVEVVITTAVQQ